MHTSSFMFIPRQPHPLVHVGERYNSSPLLRQSDWPRLLKMDLEHLPFIAFPLPLPDVTAEHDFPRKKKKVAAALSYMENNGKEAGLLLFTGQTRSFPSHWILLSLFFFFCVLYKCKTIARTQSPVCCSGIAQQSILQEGTSSLALQTVVTSATHSHAHRLKTHRNRDRLCSQQHTHSHTVGNEHTHSLNDAEHAHKHGHKLSVSY